MNNKEFTFELSRTIECTQKEASEWTNTLLEAMTEQWTDGNSVYVPAFGAFEVKKKAERIIINPVSKQRLLVPPKLALTFKPSSILKEKFK
ncbi:MAG: HU family DNA-binding protein [Prevotellaceae bacterium]|jgi:DNA-binding protein HU-beta|nr:HU family DNA-binding protein [Prevotellaceae bacterium]